MWVLEVALAVFLVGVLVTFFAWVWLHVVMRKGP